MLDGITSLAYINSLIDLMGDGYNISNHALEKMDMDYIKKEYDLIKEKKSNLSSKERKIVVRIIEREEFKEA